MAEISPLRRRMIEDMTVHNLSPATQQSYLNAVSKFSRYFGRSPDRLGLGRSPDRRSPDRLGLEDVQAATHACSRLNTAATGHRERSRSDFNLCILESEFAKTLSPGGGLELAHLELKARPIDA